MARRRSRRYRRRRQRWLAALFVAAAVLLHARCSDRIKDELGLGNEYVPDKEAKLRVVSWNLGNFPRDGQDMDRLADWVARLDPDVLALQEIRDPERLRVVLPGWESSISNGGGRGRQRVAILWRPEKLQAVGEAQEHEALALGGRVRPALSVYLQAGLDGPDFHVVVVHLKAKPDGYSQRERQWPELANVVEAFSDRDVIVLGDFNTTGPTQGRTADELMALERALEPVGLRRVPSRLACTSYWDGERRDALQEPSLLDLMWTRDLHEVSSEALQVRAFAHCGRHACAAFRSTRAHPEWDYAAVSDHCPIAIDLVPGRDDD